MLQFNPLLVFFFHKPHAIRFSVPTYRRACVLVMFFAYPEWNLPHDRHVSIRGRFATYTAFFFFHCTWFFDSKKHPQTINFFATLIARASTVTPSSSNRRAWRYAKMLECSPASFATSLAAISFAFSNTAFLVAVSGSAISLRRIALSYQCGGMSCHWPAKLLSSDGKALSYSAFFVASASAFYCLS